jgi:hypothetical protein
MNHCGTCRFSAPVKEDLTAITCYGVPPTPVMTPVMTPQGPQMQLQLFRPGLKRAERACALYQPQELVSANDTEVSQPAGA